MQRLLPIGPSSRISSICTKINESEFGHFDSEFFNSIGQFNAVIFAIVSAASTLWAASTMEARRLTHEYPFYFANAPGLFTRTYIAIWSGLLALLKTVLTGTLAALFFSGTNIKESATRIETTAMAFGATLALGSAMLIWLRSRNPNIRHWGFFRLVLPLGLLYSLTIHIWPKGRYWFWENIDTDRCLAPGRYKELGSASDCYFKISQTIDGIIETMLRNIKIPFTELNFPEFAVQLFSIFGSANLAMGLVLAPLSVLLLDLAFLGGKQHKSIAPSK